MNKLVLLIFLHFISLQHNSIGLAGPFCDVTEFPKPYVRILEKRNGPHIETLEKSGFLDLTKYIHRLLCINGPAVLYKDVRYEGPGNNTKVFNYGDLKLYTHECLIINQISTVKAIELRDAGIAFPTLNDVQITDVIGKRVTGIYLISEPLDLYLTTSVMFIQKYWDYIVTDEDHVLDGSFITVGTGPFCLNINEMFDIVLVGKNLTELSVCKWTMNDAIDVSPKFRKRYEIIFNGSLSRNNVSWRSCGPTSGSGGSGLGPYPGNLTIPTTEATPTNLDPFSIIDPKFWSSKGSSASSRKIKLEADFNLGTHTNYNDTNTEFTEEELLGDFVIELDPKMCLNLRPRLTPSTIDGNCQASTATDEKGCELLNVVLTIEQDPKNDSNPWTLKDVSEELEWKNEIMDIAAEIFSKICEPFAPTMPFTIARVVALYLAQAHKLDASIPTKPKEVWKFLKSELNRCNEGIKKPMLWYWDNREDLLTPEMVECHIETCSFGCKPSTVGDKCEAKPDLDCKKDVPFCSDTNCTFDQLSKACVHDTDPAADCGQTISCTEMPCYYDNTTQSCENPPCEVKTCLNPSSCTPSGSTCMDKNMVSGFSGGGAFPSAADIDALAEILATTGSSGGGGSSGGSFSSGGPLPFSTFQIVDTQEAIHPRSSRSYNFNGYPVNILAITQVIKKQQLARTVTADIDANTTIVGECLFFYEDMAETDFELNIAIDIHWKIFATVIGYCNNFYQLRKSETFPRLYNTYYEDFLEPIVNDWKFPKENEYLRIILSEFNSEKSQRWLDTCLESSYFISNSSTYRPPRPLTIGDSPQSNYFLQIPDFIQAQFHSIDLSKQNQTVKCP